MSKRLQVYYTAVLGALGGLLGWWAMGSLPTEGWNVWLAYPLVGAGIGMAIAGAIASAEGALLKRKLARTAAGAVRGGFAGAAFGIVGLLVAELLFLWIGGGFAGRIVGWMLMGAAIGWSDIVVSRQRRRALHGALGGLAGGLIGGALYEGLTQLFLAQSGAAQIVVGGVGLMLLGAAIGALVPLARQVLARGELRVLSGKQAGLVRELTEAATIGRYDGCDLYLPDGAVSWKHAQIARSGRGFALAVLPEAERGVLVGQREIAPGDSAALKGGELLVFGETRVLFVGR